MNQIKQLISFLKFLLFSQGKLGAHKKKHCLEKKMPSGRQQKKLLKLIITKITWSWFKDILLFVIFLTTLSQKVQAFTSCFGCFFHFICGNIRFSKKNVWKIQKLAF